MNELESKLLKEIQDLEVKFKKGEDLSIKGIKELERRVNNAKINENKVEHLLLNKLLKLRKNTLEEKLTNWELFESDMREEKGIKPILELIDEINAKLNAEEVTANELESISKKFSDLLPFIHSKFSAYNRDRTIKEFNKKIRLLDNRISRVIENDFGAWIKELRIKNGYSLKELENVCGVTASYIHRLESGSRKAPSIPLAEKLAIGLGVNPHEFLSKLNLSNTDNLDRNISLTELIAKSNFTINEEAVSTEQKNLVLELVKSILNSKWDEDNKLTEGMNILKNVESLKSSLN